MPLAPFANTWSRHGLEVATVEHLTIPDPAPVMAGELWRAPISTLRGGASDDDLAKFYYHQLRSIAKLHAFSLTFDVLARSLNGDITQGNPSC